MIVVDTSAVLEALSSAMVNQPLVERMMDSGGLHAPHLVDVELISGLRQLVDRNELTSQRADHVREDFLAMKVERYPHRQLGVRMWELRHNLSAYDACFVALSEMLEAPLVTCDARLARAPGNQARIEHFSRF